MKSLLSPFFSFFIILFFFFSLAHASDSQRITPDLEESRCQRIIRKVKKTVEGSQVNGPIAQNIIKSYSKVEEKGSLSVYRVNEIGSHAAQAVATPDGSAKRLKRTIIEDLLGSPINFNERGDENDQPNIGLDSMQSLVVRLFTPENSNSNRMRLVDSKDPVEQARLSVATRLLDDLDSPVRDKFVTVRVDHVARPRVKRDRAGVIKEVSGGHSLETYARENMGDDCFIGADGSTFGITVGGCLKTVKRRFRSHEIVMIAQDHDKSQLAVDCATGMKFHEGYDGKYYGMYDIQQNGLKIIDTIFPLLTVRACPRQPQVHIGSCAIFSSTSKECERVDRIDVSQSQYQEFLRQGVSLRPYVGAEERIIDITQPVKAYLAAQGKFSSIVGIYGVCKRNDWVF